MIISEILNEYDNPILYQLTIRVKKLHYMCDDDGNFIRIHMNFKDVTHVW